MVHQYFQETVMEEEFAKEFQTKVFAVVILDLKVSTAPV